MSKPKAVGCTCDFSRGTRGMDRCSQCGGTGSRLLIVVDGEPRYFPNTERGYVAATATARTGEGPGS